MNVTRRTQIEHIYKVHGPMILRRILRFYRRDEAQEVLHEIILKLMDQESIAEFRQESSMITWLYSITTNHCLNRLRNNKRRQELLAQCDENFLRHATHTDAHALLLCKQLWRHLDQDLLDLLVYYHVDGMTHQEIAHLMGVSRKTVGNRLDRLAEHARQLSEEARI
tara:strand:+ start:46 stop:546 length:501 start_codon:yes stop_codon:yes gene_type:complete